MLFKTLTVTINIWLYHYQRWHWEIRNTCWWLDTNNYIILSPYKRLITFIISPYTRSVYYEYHVISYFIQSIQMYSLISYKRFVKQTIVIDDFLLHDAIIPCNTVWIMSHGVSALEARPRYCTFHVYVVVHFCGNMWSFVIERNLSNIFNTL
jgi:hypothetical protein